MKRILAVIVAVAVAALLAGPAATQSPPVLSAAVGNNVCL